MVRKNSATTRETAVTYPSSESDSPLVGEHIIHRKPGFKKMTQGLLYLFLFPLNKSIPIRLNTTQLESLVFLETGSLPSVSVGYRQGVCPMGSFWRPQRVISLPFLASGAARLPGLHPSPASPQLLASIIPSPSLLQPNLLLIRTLVLTSRAHLQNPG